MPLIGKQLQGEEQKRRPGLTLRAKAKAIGIDVATYCAIRNNKRAPTYPQLVRIARYLDMPPEAFLPLELHPFTQERDGLRWNRRPDLAPQLLAIRDATHLALLGHPPDEILTSVAGKDPHACPLGDETFVEPVRAGIDLGLVELLLSPEAREIQDFAMAEELSRALSDVAPPGVEVKAHVARNFMHPDFEHDPLVPFLIAHIAHRIVGGFFRQHPHAYTLGIAGGIHLASFVHLVGADSSPFPEDGNRPFTLVPLTVGPFDDHRFDLAGPLVAELHRNAARLLGQVRLNTQSYQPCGYFVDGAIADLDTQSITVMRSHYPKLDVAIFGCGDRTRDGWMEQARRLGAKGVDPRADTDVVLYGIDQDGTPIPLPDRGGFRREHLGVGIEDLRSVTKDPRKLSLLLASGKTKGIPITLVVRAGCTNTVVCDQAGARAALTALQRK